VNKLFLIFLGGKMATYNETSLKIKKSDLIIYIIALIAFVLMIVVLMSDKIGVTRKVTSFLNNNHSHQTAVSQNNTQQTTAVNSSIQSSGEPSNSAQSETPANTASVANPNQQLVNELQQNNNNHAENASIVQRSNQGTAQDADTASINTRPAGDSRIQSEGNRRSESPAETRTGVNRERNETTDSSVNDETPAERNNNSVRANARTSAAIAERRQETVVRVPERSSVIRRERIRQPEISLRQNAPVIQTERNQRSAATRINRTSVNTASTQVQPDSNLVVVKKVQALTGDTLWKIALRNNVRTINLVYVNQLSNPDIIFPGQTINIPNR